MSPASSSPSAGHLLRTWRQRRRLTQLELSLRAHVPARHLSFVETGRSAPSRDMLLHLAEQLDVPLRERNTLLVAAGYAPTYGEHDLDSPQMQPVRQAIDRLLASHEPYPAVVVDRWWNLIAAWLISSTSSPRSAARRTTPSATTASRSPCACRRHAAR